ncbi:MAG TPA: hemolysin family protein [Iamia sp.]
MITALGLLAVLLLTLGTGYFVAAEFAFVAVRRGKLEELAEHGDRRARRAIRVHKRLSFMLSGAQLGITITSLVVGFIAEPTLGRALEPVVGAVGVESERARVGIAVGIGLFIATIGQMVVGELAPKNLAIARPEGTARRLAGPTLIFLRVAGPIIRVSDGASNRLLRAIGIEPVEELVGGVSVEELDLIVEESAEHGKLTIRQAALLERAIDFGSLLAAAAMVPWNRVTTVASAATCGDLRRIVAATTHSRFPVLDEDGGVFGVVHAKDLLDVDDDALDTTPVAALTRPPLVVPEVATLRTVLAELRREGTEMAIVADEHGAPAGVITLEDIVEELVGDISDEYDPALPEAEDLGDGRWVVPGRLRLDEIERTTGIELTEGEGYDTVAGLVMSQLQRLAQVDDRVEVAGVAVEVLAMDGWAITSVRLTPLVAPDEAPPARPVRRGGSAHGASVPDSKVSR